MDIPKNNFSSLGGLLSDKMKQTTIGKQVTIANAIQLANQYIQGVLPQGRGGDARAIHIREHILTIACKNSSVAHHLSQQSESLLQFITEHIPDCTVNRIQTKLLRSFPSSEIGREL